MGRSCGSASSAATRTMARRARESIAAREPSTRPTFTSTATWPATRSTDTSSSTSRRCTRSDMPSACPTATTSARSCTASAGLTMWSGTSGRIGSGCEPSMRSAARERGEFDNELKRIEARAGGPVPAEKRDEVLRSVLDQLVAYHLLAQESRARKLAIGDQDVEARLGEIRRSFPNEDAFKQGIAAQGLTVDQLRVQTRTSLEVAKVIDDEVTSKVAVADADVTTFYQQNLERFKQGDSVHASHILIGLPQDATPVRKAG